MATGRISSPGTEHGPCEQECHHRDYAELLKMASTACKICEEPIGYSRRFYREGMSLIHVDCAENDINHDRRKA